MKRLLIILFFFLGNNFKAFSYPIEKLLIWEGKGPSRSGIEISEAFKKGKFDTSMSARMHRVETLEAREMARIEKERLAIEKEKGANYQRIRTSSGEKAAKTWLANQEAQEQKKEEIKLQDRTKSHFTFKTGEYAGKSVHTINLRSAREKLINVSEKLKKQPANLTFRKERESLVAFADLLIEVADYEYVENDIQNGDQLVTRANLILDVEMDFLPSIGLVKDEISIITGVNPITGKGVGYIEKSIILGTFFFPLNLPDITNSLSKSALILSKIIQNSPLRADNTNNLLSVISSSDADLITSFAHDEELKKVQKKTGEITDKIVDPSKRMSTKTVEAINDMALTLITLFSNETMAIERINELTLLIPALSNKLKFSPEAMKSIVDKQKTVPLEMLAIATKIGIKKESPFSKEGFALYISDIFKKGAKYKLEVTYRETDNMIHNFLLKK